jgi:uncharacterized FlaG/YvyC family protein
MVILVVDRETEEVIREIPPGKLDAIISNSGNLKGLLVNRQG